MVKSIESLARGLQVVDAIRQHAPASLATLHQSTGISKATLLRILKTLQEAGWVYRALGDATYRLSFSLNRQVPTTVWMSAWRKPRLPSFRSCRAGCAGPWTSPCGMGWQ